MWYLGTCELCDEYKNIGYCACIEKDICLQCFLQLQALAILNDGGQ